MALFVNLVRVLQVSFAMYIMFPPAVAFIESLYHIKLYSRSNQQFDLSKHLLKKSHIFPNTKTRKDYFRAASNHEEYIQNRIGKTPKWPRR